MSLSSRKIKKILSTYLQIVARVQKLATIFLMVSPALSNFSLKKIERLGAASAQKKCVRLFSDDEEGTSMYVVLCETKKWPSKVCAINFQGLHGMSGEFIDVLMNIIYLVSKSKRSFGDAKFVSTLWQSIRSTFRFQNTQFLHAFMAFQIAAQFS